MIALINSFGPFEWAHVGCLLVVVYNFAKLVREGLE